jgi:hypothetical protein
VDLRSPTGRRSTTAGQWMSCGEAVLQVPAAAPTRQQKAALGACLEDTLQLHNAALEERREAWRLGRHRIALYGRGAQLKD